MRKCRYCHQPIVLMPSAKERAARYGNTPQFYTNIFQAHPDCIIKARKEAVKKLIERNQKENVHYL